MPGTEERSSYWNPSRNYEISCKVGKVDLTNDLAQMVIVSSVEVPYRTYVLDLFLDPDDMILDKIYGQEPIKIGIKTYGTSENIPHELIQTNLMALGTKYDLLMKDTDPQVPDKIRASTRIRAVPLEGYSVMTAFVNGVYLESNLRTIVDSLVAQAGGTLRYDTEGANVTVYDQIIVPPAPLYKALQYLDRTFGFFNGLAGIYSSATQVQRKSNSAVVANIKPQVFLRNMSAEKRRSNIVVTQLSNDNNQQEQLVNIYDGKTFYTYNPVETEWTGNTIFSLYGDTMKHVVKPKDELFRTIELNTSEFANEYGITTKKDQIFFSQKGQEKRTSFFKDHTGYNDVETHIRSIHSKYFAQMSVLKVHLEKWLLLERLMDVGTGAIFRSNIQDVRDLTGNYVLKFSLTRFLKSDLDWECGVTLHLIRTNRIN